MQMDAFLSLKDIYCKQQQRSCLMRSPILTLHWQLHWPAHYKTVISEFLPDLSSTFTRYQWMMQKVSICSRFTVISITINTISYKHAPVRTDATGELK